MKKFWRFSIAKSEGEHNKIFQIFIYGFQCVAKNIEGWLNISTSYMANSEIWLNLLTDPPFLQLPGNDCHFG
jgi:hypothetical protein